MSKETITRIENEVETCETLDSARKTEILRLIRDLQKEIDTLEHDSESARRVASYAESSVFEATRSKTDQEMLQHSLDGLSLAVRRFEVSHPNLVTIINNIGRTLGSLGI